MSMAERGYEAVDFSQFMLPEEDAATIPPEQVAPPVDAAQGIRESIAGMDAAARADALRGLGPGFLGQDFYNQYNPDGTVRGATGTGTTGTGTGRTGETEAERIARLDREESARQFAASQAAEAAARGQRRENAFGIISSFLQRAGLAGLEGNIRQLLAQGIEDTDAILFSLRDTEQFRTRFKANAARERKGLPALDPATYIGLEQSYASTLRANRLPSGFYDQSDDFNALIEGDVSPQELQARISEGFVKVRDADPEVRRQMQTLYGVGSDEQLAAYFLDPEKGLQALQRQARAAEISARGREQGRLQLTVGQAEELARRGITSEEAQRQFMQRGMLEGLYQPLYGEQALTGEEEIGAIFEYDPEAQKRLQQRRAQRLGEFQGGGQFARTSGATSGTVETGVGTAQ
jgi:hypothetical protein